MANLKTIDSVIEEAKKSYLRIRVGALIVHRNKIISKGHNYSKKGYIGRNECPL